MVDIYDGGGIAAGNCCVCVSAMTIQVAALLCIYRRIYSLRRSSLYSMFHYRYNIHTSYNIQKTAVGGGCVQSIDPVRGFLADFIFLFPLSFSFVRPDDPSSRPDQQRIFSFSPVFFFLFFYNSGERKQIKRLRESKKQKKKKNI